ncbi:Uncharacterised protein [Klebsiella pneumoniae]|uniref:hypothetical protein n=1 Tax=Klebsiella pneumoniae TaxID=573 RepID=UPI0010DB9D69|nr:hypothetical protein [Klebsiella pneumoniae]VGA66937.1 Uncharacterised protein [Klebsiella pneumoniae]
MNKSTITREQLIKKAQEQIEFCRHTKITGEGRAHVNQCAALFEIALAAMDSEPVFFIEVEGDDWINAGRIEGKNRPDLGLLPDGINYLYAAPQPLTDAEREELQERRKADSEPVVPVVPDFKKLARELVDNLVDCGGLDEGVKEKYLEWAEKTCRAAMLQAGNCRENANSSTNNCREIPETSTNRSREHFISLCNEFWNWSEMDEVCAEDRGYELRMEWDGKVFKHPVTQALWRMYHAAPQEVK